MTQIASETIKEWENRRNAIKWAMRYQGEEKKCQKMIRILNDEIQWLYNKKIKASQMKRREKVTVMCQNSWNCFGPDEEQ